MDLTIEEFMVPARTILKSQFITARACCPSHAEAGIPSSVSDRAKAAVLLACDSARMVTGMVVNSTAGAAAD